MSKLILYSYDPSPPCRAVLMVAEAIGVPLEIREINLFKQDHLSEKFLKINPQHTIPVLDDNGFIVCDSHAIMCYLVNKYAKDDSLYPKDPQKRATIDQHLYFDTGVLFTRMRDIFRRILFMGETSVSKSQLETVEDAYGFLEKILDGKKWLAGNSYTLADISCAATMSSVTVLRALDDYPNLNAWLKRCEEQLPGYEKLNKPGNNELHAVIRSKLA